jgi:hypothetical protein
VDQKEAAVTVAALLLATEPSKWRGYFGTNAGGWSSNDTYPRELADITGDGKADIVGFGSTGVWSSASVVSASMAAPASGFALLTVEQSSNPDKIGTININGTGLTEFSTPTTGSKPQGITVGSDGALWFTEEASNKIGQQLQDLVKIDQEPPKALRVESPRQGLNPRPRALRCLGRDRIDPQTRVRLSPIRRMER